MSESESERQADADGAAGGVSASVSACGREAGTEAEAEAHSDFGSQMECFYVALRGGDPYALSEAMCVLEDSAAEAAARAAGGAAGGAGEGGTAAQLAAVATMEDVVADCQKKCAQALRARVADAVSSLLAAARKKLRAKTSLDSESSGQHRQRHVLCLLELLGGWSDLVAGILQGGGGGGGGVSAKVVYLVVVPFHLRVMEVAFECFEQFKSDKNITSWLRRVSEPDAGPGPGAGAGAGAGLNLVALDQVSAQLAGMRELTTQYQAFLLDACGLADVPLREFEAWKELDVVYCALDYAYTGAALAEAVRDARRALLLRIEDGRSVFVLQGVEDAFFVLRRGVGRAISTGSDTILFGAMDRVVELLGYDADADADADGGGGGSARLTLLQAIVGTAPYYRAVARHAAAAAAAAAAAEAAQGAAKADRLPASTSRPDLAAGAGAGAGDDTLERTEAMINSECSYSRV
jgi:hypothetical protein